MTPSPFRSAAVACGIVTASLAFGVLTPDVATAASADAPTSSRPSASDAVFVPDLPVDPLLESPAISRIEDTFAGSRAVTGFAGTDDVYLLDGDETVSRWAGGQGLFLLRALDKYRDTGLDLVRVHIAADGTATRTERIPLPRTLRVDGLRAENRFVPGPKRFEGTATVGATITATDTVTGTTLFRTEVPSARSAVGTWSAEADLTAGDHTITFSQTLPDGRKSTIERVVFSEGTGATPAAPQVQPSERRLDGDFTLWGAVDDRTVAVEVRAGSGTRVGETRVVDGEFVATVPQEHLGATLEVVGISEDGSESPATRAELLPLAVDPDVEAPGVRDVNVLPNGSIQLVGDVKRTAGLQVLDGDVVVAHIRPDTAGWSFTIGQAHTGRQLDLVALAFNGQHYSATSERLALPRLLQVDGIHQQNDYTPGTRRFSGSAEAGATVVATDQHGAELFRARAAQTRSGIAAWSASAELSSRDGYEVTFTQTTADGRTSVMQDIAFTPATDETQPIEPATVQTTAVSAGALNTFTGTATPNASIRVRNAWGTQIVPGTVTADEDGDWSFQRVVSTGATKFDFVIEQTLDGTVDTSRVFSIAAAAALRDASVATSSVSPGVLNTFTGTATPNASIRVRNAWGTQIVPGTVTADEDGDWSFQRVVSTGATKFNFVIEQTLDGTVATSRVFSIRAS
ncbi:hypothetical protein [Curtobacterium sp. BRB10]|uniref:hypothetical protein n=1 Tax=Curtobacterium sp. BRB10 TaxID=2962579 RepID=UPI002880F649|nr:hypothetical protein [Curtobacterium sp. BRB10]MDT0234151.1 hypothetical protein [Curtobacterium sp. BRB10]